MAQNVSWINIGVCCMLLTVRFPPSLASECNGDSCRDVITMPLLDDMKASLKADLDVTNMNNHLKAYIEQQIQKGFETAMNDIMRQLIDNKLEVVNATIEATIIEELERYGVTYVRWGRKGCPDGAELVYTGQAGGNYYNHKGGGANYLCLPNDPEIGEPQSYENSQLYGAEYQVFSNRKPHGMSGILGDREVPCGVCRRKRRSSVITIPGTGEDTMTKRQCMLFSGHQSSVSKPLLSTVDIDFAMSNATSPVVLTNNLKYKFQTQEEKPATKTGTLNIMDT
ncbi:uncharacterized protein [Mytilus edulis]|uniref:uncharacterized protein isoform X2 n=1 Tax=Mytilus edulis TaxID=6550 RepID=UPI0039F07115